MHRTFTITGHDEFSDGSLVVVDMTDGDFRATVHDGDSEYETDAEGFALLFGTLALLRVMSVDLSR